MHGATSDVVAMGWDDCLLWGLAWHADGRDLWLDVERSDGRRGTIRCTWVGGFEIEIRYADNRSGPTLSGEAEFTHSAGRWTATWSFPGEGFMQFTCQDIAFAAKDG
jgi:hypothetical protein